MTGTKSIDKTLIVLKHLLAGSSGRVDEIAEHLNMSLATLYRHIAALERSGLIFRKDRSSFSEGVFLLRKFNRTKFNALMRNCSRPAVIDLSKKLNLTVHLGVFEEDMVTYLLKTDVEGSDLFTRETTQLDAYCSGLGKVLLAGLPADELDRYFAIGKLPKITDATITNEHHLRAEIEKIRESGFAIDNQEFEEGLFCIASPIFDRDNQMLGALSVSSKIAEHVSENLKVTLKALVNAAERIQWSIYSNAIK